MDGYHEAMDQGKNTARAFFPPMRGLGAFRELAAVPLGPGDAHTPQTDIVPALEEHPVYRRRQT